MTELVFEALGLDPPRAVVAGALPLVLVVPATGETCLWITVVSETVTLRGAGLLTDFGVADFVAECPR